MSDERTTAHGSADAHLGQHARFGPFAALAIAALVRFHDLGARSLWTDEGSTWTAASLPLGAMVRRCIERDASPPLYYLLTSWALRFGQDEAHLRLVSVLASLALVWLTYRLARLALGRNAATFAAMMTALSPFQLMYAQEARTYTLAAALLVGGTYAWARTLVKPSRSSWWAFVIMVAAGLWTQTIAALGLSAQGAIGVLTPEGRRRFLPWVGGLVAAALLYLPWAWLSRGMSDQLSNSHWYIGDTDASSLFKVFRASLLSPMPLVGTPAGSAQPGLDAYLPAWLAWVFVGLPPLVALGFTLPGMFRGDARGTLTRVAWAGWIVPIAAVLAASLVHPLFLVRYFVFVTPFVATLFALGLSRMRPLLPRWILGGLLLGMSLFGIARYEHDYTKEPWREITADLMARCELPHDRVTVLVPFDVDPFAFYDRRSPQPVDRFEVGHPNEPFAAAYTPRELDELEAAARAHAAPFDEVWVIVRSPNSAVRREVARRALAVAGEQRELVGQREWVSSMGRMRVAHFVRRGPSTP